MISLKKTNGETRFVIDLTFSICYDYFDLIFPNPQVGMEGERLGIHAEEGLKKVKWEKASGKEPGMTWYQVNKLNLSEKIIGSNLSNKNSDLMNNV